ncbi:hypothetical protein [Hymenobacter negativus]|uniref:Uncharacterized protein n=1 Tax=Hymenobacter negativus TaxID=2795026 RepID=A0ABS3QPC1_9BACT|nr:hypothetical protein [Hymenobacter negativus]MBO2012921.1 hypothetical protein [Hymenobacter negativus]
MPRYVHKRFRRLSIYFSHEAIATLPFRRLLCTRLTAHYSTFLRGSSFDGIHTILLFLTNLPTENRRVEKKVVGYLDYYLVVDFQLLVRLATDQERQQYLLARMQAGVRQFVQQQGWDMARFERAYQACIAAELPVEIQY